MKWRILLQLPSYSTQKQSKIILACMSLHNFIQESAMEDADFDICDTDQNYMPFSDRSRLRLKKLLKISIGTMRIKNVNAFRHSIANGLPARRE